MQVDVTVGDFSSLKYVLVSLVFFGTSPDLICVFLIIVFVFCDIVERVSYSQIAKYFLRSL